MILSYQYQNETNKINNDYKSFEEIIKNTLSTSYNIVAISNDEWKVARQEYVNRLNAKEQYEVIYDDFLNNEVLSSKQEIEQKSEMNNSNTIDNKVFELFDSKDIEIK